MKKQTGSIFVATLIFLCATSIPIVAQNPPDLEVSDPQFIYDVNTRFSRSAFDGKDGFPSTIVTDSPVQRVSALFRNRGSKPIKSVSWEYITFKDAEEKEVWRVSSVRSNTRILPGESVRLGKEGYHLPDSQYKRIRVTHIESADGTIWQGTKRTR